MCIRDRNNTEHWGHYNAHTVNEVVVVTVNKDYEEKDIVITLGMTDYIVFQKQTVFAMLCNTL